MNVEKMKPEIKAKWLEALRGGGYKQGIGHLNGEKGFCCLGVLTDLAVKEGVGEWAPPEGAPIRTFVPASGEWMECSMAYLASPVGLWSGLNRQRVYDLGLMVKNDSGDWDFNRIADLIEEAL